jgi:hypothetical protein
VTVAVDGITVTVTIGMEVVHGVDVACAIGEEEPCIYKIGDNTRLVNNLRIDIILHHGESS